MTTVLKEFDQGKNCDQMLSEYGVSRADFYWCRQRYGGLEASELTRL